MNSAFTYVLIAGGILTILAIGGAEQVLASDASPQEDGCILAHCPGDVALSTDAAFYGDGDVIRITGSVATNLEGYPITLWIVAPNDNVVAIAQLDIEDDLTFSHDVVAGGTLWQHPGTYAINVFYGSKSRTAETSVAFEGSGNETPWGEVADLEVITVTAAGHSNQTGDGEAGSITEIDLGYTLDGGSLLAITPDEKNALLVIDLNTTEDGTLTLYLPRAVLDARTEQCSGDDDAFFVIVDGEEAEFEETIMRDSRTLSIDFFAGSEEVIIIGTCVIPEFGAFTILIMAVAAALAVAISPNLRLGTLR